MCVQLLAVLAGSHICDHGAVPTLHSPHLLTPLAAAGRVELTPSAGNSSRIRFHTITFNLLFHVPPHPFLTAQDPHLATPYAIRRAVLHFPHPWEMVLPPPSQSPPSDRGRPCSSSRLPLPERSRLTPLHHQAPSEAGTIPIVSGRRALQTTGAPRSIKSPRAPSAPNFTDPEHPTPSACPVTALAFQCRPRSCHQ
jgi:hypothetical protein